MIFSPLLRDCRIISLLNHCLRSFNKCNHISAPEAEFSRPWLLCLYYHRRNIYILYQSHHSCNHFKEEIVINLSFLCTAQRSYIISHFFHISYSFGLFFTFADFPVRIYILGLTGSAGDLKPSSWNLYIYLMIWIWNL